MVHRVTWDFLAAIYNERLVLAAIYNERLVKRILWFIGLFGTSLLLSK